MPQGALQANIATNPANARAPLVVDGTGAQLVASGKGTTLNVATTTLIKAGPGRVVKVGIVTVATAGTFGVYDAATTGAAATSNAIVQAVSAYPAAGTAIPLDFPVTNGIVINPGTSGVVSVSFA